MKKPVDLTLVPENIKNIAARALPSNRFTTVTEKMVAQAQLEAVVDYCNQAITQIQFSTKK